MLNSKQVDLQWKEETIQIDAKIPAIARNEERFWEKFIFAATMVKDSNLVLRECCMRKKMNRFRAHKRNFKTTIQLYQKNSSNMGWGIKKETIT